MEANQAVIVWNWDDAGVYTGPKPQIDVIDSLRQGEAGVKKWQWHSRLIWKYQPGLTEAERMKLAFLQLLHDLTVWGIPVDDVVHAFYKIDEYQAMLREDVFPYRKNKRQEATCPTL